MPKIQSKRVRVKDPDTGIWHDLPATVSKEAMEAAERADRAAQSAIITVEEVMEKAVIKPWYKIWDLSKFGLFQTFDTPYTASEYYNDARSYGEGVCIDTKRNYICALSNVEVGEGNVYIARYDGNTGELIDTNMLSVGTGGPSFISYLDDKDKLLVCMKTGSPRDFYIDPDTMTLDGSISQTNIGLDYDAVYNEYAGIWRAGGTNAYRLTLFSTSYEEKETIDLDMVDPAETWQGWSIYDGILYFVTYNKIFEIDYKKGRSNIIDTIPFIPYNSGIEIQQIYASSLGIVALAIDKTHAYILKYDMIAGENLETIPYTKDNNSKKMSNVYPATATLFAYIVNLEAPYEDTIWCYGGTRFTDLPTLYNGTAYITKVYINKPVSNICYTKIEVELYRAAYNTYRKFAGFIISGSGAITWVEIPTVQAVDAAPTFSATYGAASSLFYEQQGHIISYTFIYVPSQDVSAGTTIATGFVPSKVNNIPFLVLDNDGTGNDKIFHFYIDTSGNLKTSDALTSGHSYRCNCVYVGKARFD